MTTQNLTSEFGEIAPETSKSLGASRASVIASLVRNVKNGYCTGIDATVNVIVLTMRQAQLDPENLEDCAKVGIPGGMEALKDLYHKTPKKPAVTSSAPSIIASIIALT